MEKKQCLECQDHFFGRSDKKYCSDLCRNAFNNRIRSRELFFISQINSILKKNRKILAECTLNGSKIIHRDKLLIQGFNFNYFTHICRTSSGHEYFYCYEQGYQIQKDNYIKIRTKEPVQ